MFGRSPLVRFDAIHDSQTDGVPARVVVGADKTQRRKRFHTALPPPNGLTIFLRPCAIILGARQVHMVAV